jgi:opacity protein-like surface antigen
MRRLLLAAMMCGAALQGAQAADLPVLRGSLWDAPQVGPTNWEGFYIGGQGAYGSADMDFSGVNSAQTARMLAGTAIESEMGVSDWPMAIGKSSQRNSAFGGFIGYNAQWDDAVLGVEFSYLHGDFNGSSDSSVSRVSGSPLTSDNMYHAVTATSGGAMQITDMASLRGRAGWAVGSVMPYMFGGLALANANIYRTVTVEDGSGATPADARNALRTGSPITNFATQTVGDVQHNHLLIGYSAGLGIDMNLYAGLFLRAEWEYTRFTGAVDTSINTVRAGLGYKF